MLWGIGGLLNIDRVGFRNGIWMLVKFKCLILRFWMMLL